MVERPDLLDRSIVLELPIIETRQTKEKVWRELTEARPRLLGALLDAVSVGLRNWEAVKVEDLPRMADFARWVEACAPALGWPPGSFVRAYANVQREVEAQALTMWSVFDFIRQVAEKNGYEGTVMKLKQKLDLILRSGGMGRPLDWPTTPRALGFQLRRYAPSLRRVRITVSLGDKRRDGKRVSITKNLPLHSVAIG